jgi:hypothetical protein
VTNGVTTTRPTQTGDDDDSTTIRTPVVVPTVTTTGFTLTTALTGAPTAVVVPVDYFFTITWYALPLIF